MFQLLNLMLNFCIHQHIWHLHVSSSFTSVGIHVKEPGGSPGGKDTKQNDDCMKCMRTIVSTPYCNSKWRVVNRVFASNFAKLSEST